jgi:hypothetical protein
LKSIALGVSAAAVACALARPASGQIISTMVPMETQSPSAAAPAGPGPTAAWHVMGGFAHWSFGGDKALKDDVASKGGTSSGGNKGFILAGDVAFKAGRNMSVGFGGWYNKLTDFEAHVPARPGFFAVDQTSTHSFSSFYGNVFYKNVGVQAGVIPLRGHTTISVPANGFNGTDDNGQTDFAIFGVARTGSKPGRPRWSAVAGLGLYRYGSRPATTTLGFEASPAANAFTIFVNGSVGVYKRFSVDGSIWFTAADSNFSFDSGIGNQSQTRFTIGIGYGF